MNNDFIEGKEIHVQQFDRLIGIAKVVPTHPFKVNKTRYEWLLNINIPFALPDRHLHDHALICIVKAIHAPITESGDGYANQELERCLHLLAKWGSTNAEQNIAIRDVIRLMERMNKE